MLTFTQAKLIHDVPNVWIYYYYLDLKVMLNGQNLKLRSFINSDTTPSLCLFQQKGVYRWKDFSSGEGGSAVDLVICKHFHETGEFLDYIPACKKIVQDYNEYVKIHGIFKAEKIESHTLTYEMSAKFEVKPWGELDDEFWYNRYGIRESHAKKFNIYPLRSYQLQKTYAEYVKTYPEITGEYIYGYFTESGELYQIYQPYVKEMKFIKLKRCIQGLDQAVGVYDILIIGSCLKDIAVGDTLGLHVEWIAPPSESTLLGVEEIKQLRTKYKYIFTLFDNDDPGIKAMKRYQNLYDIDYIIFPYEKDLSDCREVHGFNFLKRELIIRINKKLNE